MKKHWTNTIWEIVKYAVAIIMTLAIIVMAVYSCCPVLSEV